MISRNDAGKIAHVASLVRPERKDKKAWKLWVQYTTALCNLCMLENRDVLGGVFMAVANQEVAKDDPAKAELGKGLIE